MFAKKESYSLEKLPKENPSAAEDCSRCEENIITDRKQNQKYSFTKLKAFLVLFYLLLHAIFIQGISVIVKKVSYISVSQLSLVRYAGMFAISLPLAIFCNKEILSEKKNWFLLVARGLLSSNGLFLQIVAYRYLQLIEASIVMAILPFVTAVAARILIKESLGLIQIITLVTTICGVLLSLHLPEMLSDENHNRSHLSFILGLITSLVSVLFLALSTVVLRKVKEVHFSISMLYVSFFGMIQNAVLCGTVFPLTLIKCGWDQLLCVLVAIFGVASNGCFTLATQIEPAGLVAVQLSSFDILVTAVYQILFFTNYPDAYVISGAFLVLVSLTAIGVKNWVSTLPETSSKRQKLKWILS